MKDSTSLDNHLSKVIHKSKMVETEYHLFATLSELMNLNIEYQWLLMLKGKKSEKLDFLKKEHKGIEPEPDEASGSIIIACTERQRTYSH